MILALNIFAITLSAIVAVPAGVFLLECLLAAMSRRHRSPVLRERARPVAIIVPAHDESLLIASTVRSIKAQLRPGDRLLVVADNCTDSTATLAAEAGAEVIARIDLNHRGKGFALAYGFDHLRSDPPDIVMVFDADCVIEAGAIDHLCSQVCSTQRPAQAAYVMDCPVNPSPRDAVSSLAFTVKNIVRPTGLAMLRLPCVLTGTGMAFPWELVSGVNLASGHLVEDLQLGVELIRRGEGPQLCRAAVVRSILPTDPSAAMRQRTRWEHGHLQVIRSGVLPLFLRGLATLRPGMLFSAVDLAVPPVALLVAMTILSGVVGLCCRSWIATSISLGSLCGVVLGVVLAWLRFARHIPVTALLSTPMYVLWKIPMYCRFVIKPQTSWVRTTREPVSHSQTELESRVA